MRTVLIRQHEMRHGSIHGQKKKKIRASLRPSAPTEISSEWGMIGSI